MPDQNNSGRRDFSEFDAMTTEELRDILRNDALNLDGESDIDMLMYVHRLIREREQPDPNRKTAEQAFEEFKTHYLYSMTPEEENSVSEKTAGAECKVLCLPRWVRRLAAVAAVVVLILSALVIPVNAERETFFKIAVNWTKDTFLLYNERQSTTTEPLTLSGLEFDSLEEALITHNINIPLTPTWIPDGYVYYDLKVKINPSTEVFVGIYKKGDEILKVQIQKFVAVDPIHIEKSDEQVVEYESGGVVYYIFPDNDDLHATWIVENYQGLISGKLTLEEMKQIIDSIHKEP